MGSDISLLTLERELGAILLDRGLSWRWLVGAKAAGAGFALPTGAAASVGVNDAAAGLEADVVPSPRSGCKTGLGFDRVCVDCAHWVSIGLASNDYST